MENSWRLFGVAMVLLPGAALSQINSGPQLKQACENSVGNVVQITHPTKIEFGPTTTVNTGCTIHVANGVSFEVKQVNMTFAGPLTILGVYQSTIAFEETAWSAASVDISAVHYGQVIAKKASWQATAGDISVSLSHYGKLELIGPASTPNVLDAFGAVTISTGLNGSGVLEGANIGSGLGVSVRGSGSSPLKLVASNLSATGGSVAVSGGSTLEIGGGTFTGTGVTAGVGVSGLAKIKDVVFSGGAGSVAVTGGASGSIEMNQSSLSSASTVTVGTGASGKTLVDNVQLNGAAGVLVQSGGGSTAITLVKNSQGTSSGTVTIRSGGGGLCTAESNAFTAPVVQSCGL